MADRLRMEELVDLYGKLSQEDRDELLQCLLIAATRGGEAMIEVLEQLLLCHATEELLDEHDDFGGQLSGADEGEVEGEQKMAGGIFVIQGDGESVKTDSAREGIMTIRGYSGIRRQHRWVALAAAVTIVLTSVFFLVFPVGQAEAFKPAAHQVLLEKVRDSLPQGSIIRQAIENNFKVANWGSDGPDLGYGYWRSMFGYAPWGDRCHYHLVGSMAAEQLRQALASGVQWKIAWAAGWLTHVCGDMAVHGILVNPEAGVYLEGGNHEQAARNLGRAGGVDPDRRA
jgi:hypothetical protein